MKYIFKKAINVHSSGEYKMAADEATEVSKRSFTTAPNQFFTQTSAVTLLASMIASTDAPMPHTGSVLPVPLLSPSPTLPNFLTPSPTRPSFSFGLQERQDTSRALAGIPASKEKEPITHQRPSIKIKLKKVASSDKYVIETPKHVKKETVALGGVNIEQTSIKNEPSDMESMVPQYHLGASGSEQFLQMPPSIGEHPVDFPSDPVSFTHLGGLGPSLLGNPVSANQPDASDVEGIFQTLPGGATSSPGGMDVDNPYGFESGLVDSTFDIDAEIEAANVAGVPSDATAFDISNVYDPGVSTSSASAMVGSFDIDSTFDLDTILPPGSQSSDGSVNGGMLDWGLGNDSNIP